MYRITVRRISEINEYLKEQMERQHAWALVEFMYTRFRKEQMECFNTRELAERFQRQKGIKSNPIIVPLRPPPIAFNLLVELRETHAIHIWDVHINLQDLLKIIKKEQNHLLTDKTNVMNEKNFDYLSKQIQFTGFGDGHKDELMQKMKENKPEFTIFHQQDFGKDSTVATLQFRRPEDGDMYFFNRYSLMLKGPKHEEPIKQIFYINNDMKKKEQEDITLKEGYNLLSGRAVQKDLVNKNGEKYTAWMQLDFKITDKHGNYEEKKFHQNYGYDLEQLLSKHPIKELNTIEDKKMLMESLQRGNRQAVTFQINGQEQRIFIEAAPQFKSINMYDSGLKRVNAQSVRESKGEQQAQQQDKKESLKVNHSAAGDDESPAQSEKKGRKRGQKLS